jgi:hypothetical protein
VSWSSPTTPNLADYTVFVQQGMGISPLILPTVILPVASNLTAGNSGSLPSETIYVRTTYISALGETTGSTGTSAAVTGPTGSVAVASPPTATGATGWNIYAANAAGAETLQNGSPLTLGAPHTLTTLTMGAPPPATPTASSPWVGYAFDQATALVLNVGALGVAYTLAVYNCAAHIQIRITPDQAGRESDPNSFTTMRKSFNLLLQSVGVVQATSDAGTSTTIAVSDALKQLTLTDLGFMKTPWGREYLSFAQDYGPSVWGLS